MNEHMQPGSGEKATAQEREALKARGLWDDGEGPSHTQYWSQYAVLEAYRAGYADAEP